MKFKSNSTRKLDIDSFCRYYIIAGTNEAYVGLYPCLLYKHNIRSIIINFILAVVACYITNLDLFWFVVCFVLTDIVLLFIDYVVFSRRKRCSIKDILKQKQYVDKLKSEYDRGYEITVNNVDTGTTSTQRAFDLFYENIVKENQYLETLENQVLMAEAKSNTKLSKDYEDKQKYIKDVCKRFDILSSDFACAGSLSMSLKKLSEVLETKPAALQQIPYKVYMYLDELQKVANQILGLDSDNRDYYVAKMEDVAKLLDSQINDCIEAVNNFEAKDIEVTLNVLLSELKGLKNGGGS